MGKIAFLVLIAILIFVSSCAKEQQNAPIASTESKMAKYVTIETDKGTIKAELYTQKAPITAKNFIDLANSGFYNGLTFHRVEPGFAGTDFTRVGGGFVFFSLNAERRSQWRLIPCISSSACTTALETCARILSLD